MSMDLSAGPWAIGVFVRLNENSGNVYQYLLSMEAADGTPKLHILLGESGAASPTNGRWGFNITDDVGNTTGSVFGGEAVVPNPADNVERLLVLQSTGATVELWACAVGGGGAVKLCESPVDLSLLTSSAEPTTWYFGRRTDGSTTRFYEEQAGGLFKADAALTTTQMEQIAGGADPAVVLAGSIRAHWPFLNGAVAVETDVVSGLQATRFGAFAVASGSQVAITSRSPSLYIIGEALTDASASGQTVTDQGGTISFGQAMARGTGMRLNGSYLQVNNTAARWAVDSGALDVDVQCEFGAGMDCIIPVGVLRNDLVLMSMEDDEAIHRHGWTIWAHGDRSVELQVRQPWQPARMRSPANVITEGVQFHVQMVLGRDGMMLYLDGRRLDNGIKNSLVWHGLDRRERNTQSRNTSHFRVGATGSTTSTPSDIIVGHVFAFVRSGHANELLDADCQAIAGASGSAHPHRIWGNSVETIGPGTNVIQAAIDRRVAAGGGRVILSAGTYTQSVSLNLKSRVELIGAGNGTDPASNSIINVTNNQQVTTAAPSLINYNSVLTGDIALTTKVRTISGHGLGADDVLLFMSNVPFHGLYHPGGLSNLNNPNERCSELAPIEKIIDSNTIRLDRRPQFAYPASQREGIARIVPYTDIGLRNLRIQRTYVTGTSPGLALFGPDGVRRLRLSGVVVQENGTGTKSLSFQTHACVDVWTDPEARCTVRNNGLNDNSQTTFHPYTFQHEGSRGVVAHSCTLHGGGWHAVDAVGFNIAADWPGADPFPTGSYLLNGHLCVVDSIVTGGGGGTASGSGTRNRLNTHGGIKHVRFFNITMPNGGGWGFGGGYHDWVDIQAEGPGTSEPVAHMSHTYGAWRCYAYKCHHKGTSTSGWFYAYTQRQVKSAMVDCVFAHVTKNNTVSNNTGTTWLANNTVRSTTGPIPTTGFVTYSSTTGRIAPLDPMT